MSGGLVARGLLTPVESAHAPAVFGALSALAVLAVWGSLAPAATVHDEFAYLLQARLFAHGQWAAPTPPAPEFFEQMHVLLVPARAAKYPPGHSLVLALGVAFGVPALVPLLLSGWAGGLLFALARRLAGGEVALLAWLFWIGAPGNLNDRSLYLSETTTSWLWLLGWWGLLRWRDTGRARYLFLLAAATGWGAITRPLTMLLFALPVFAVVLRIDRARRAWRDIAVAAALGAAVLALIPVWSARTTGDWRLTPLQLYTRQYMPYDLPGFSPPIAKPQRALPPVLREANEQLERLQAAHRWQTLPATLWLRLCAIARDCWGDGRVLLLLFLAGLTALRTEGRLAAVTSALLVLGYLTYWYDAWAVYYLEIQPVVAFATALGAWRLLSVLIRRLPSPGAKPGPAPGEQRRSRAVAALAGVLAILAVLQVRSSAWSRR
ncbi:MAG TPA: glycosyltransferase family 39 protein, partial [Thermoanaerobaculia bacterium]|nr:glycosyltransferase family 39 protein [Thermoanaerobaculia bacterium]